MDFPPGFPLILLHWLCSHTEALAAWASMPVNVSMENHLFSGEGRWMETGFLYVALGVLELTL